MKKYLLLFIVLSFLTIDVSAQKFLRYYLQDSVYHGFYTDEIDSIVNDVDYTIIYARDSSFRISVSNIDSVVVEAATIDEDTVVNYRIYEFNIDDSAYPFRKIIVDNRASLLVSTNGTFDRDDTVLIYSAYYGVQMFCILDSLGRIRELYDTSNLLLFDYTEDSCNIVVFNKTDSSWQELTIALDVRDTRPVAGKNLIRKLFRLRGTAWHDLAGLGLSFAGNMIWSNVEMMRDAYDRPDNYAGRIGVDIAGIIRDGIGVGASIAGEPFTGGLSTTVLALSTKSLFDDFKGLVNDIFPDDERMQRYKDYYRNHYGITLALQPVEILGSCGAVLSANLYTSSKNLGNVGFHVLQTNPFDADNSFVYRSDRIDTIALGHYKLGTVVFGLTPNTEYNCSILDYSININGLKLTYLESDFLFQPQNTENTFIVDNVELVLINQQVDNTQLMANFDIGCYCNECEYGIEYYVGEDSSAIIRESIQVNDSVLSVNMNFSCNSNIRYRAYSYNHEYTYSNWCSFTTGCSPESCMTGIYTVEEIICYQDTDISVSWKYQVSEGMINAVTNAEGQILYYNGFAPVIYISDSIIPYQDSVHFHFTICYGIHPPTAIGTDSIYELETSVSVSAVHLPYILSDSYDGFTRYYVERVSNITFYSIPWRVSYGTFVGTPQTYRDCDWSDAGCSRFVEFGNGYSGDSRFDYSQLVDSEGHRIQRVYVQRITKE